MPGRRCSAPHQLHQRHPLPGRVPKAGFSLATQESLLIPETQLVRAERKRPALVRRRPDLQAPPLPLLLAVPGAAEDRIQRHSLASKRKQSIKVAGPYESHRSRLASQRTVIYCAEFKACKSKAMMLKVNA